MRLALFAIAVLASGCPSVPSAYVCHRDEQCADQGKAGTCEPIGYCSFDDSTCAGGRRYSEYAGQGLARRCVLGVGLPPRMPESSGKHVLVVDPVAGDDAAADGSEARPYQTVNAAIDAVDLQGGIIDIRGEGVTIHSGAPSAYAIAWAKQGDPSDPVTIRARSPLGVTIGGTGSGGAFTLGAWIHAGGAGLRLRGLRFAVTGVGSIGVQVDYGSSDIEIDACEIAGNGGTGLTVKGGAIGTGAETARVQLWSSLLHDNAADCDPASSGLACTYGGLNALLGTVSGGATGTDDAGLHGGVVANNVFIGSIPGHHLELGPQAHDVYVVNNDFYGNAGHANKGFPDASNAGNAITIFNTGDTYPSSGIVIENNIMAVNRGHAVFGSGSMNMASNQVQVNLAWANDNLSGGLQVDFPTTSNGTVLYTIGAAGNLPDGDPGFVDRVGGDLHLTAGSPAAGAADPVYTPQLDRDGRVRITADLGAYAAP